MDPYRPPRTPANPPSAEDIPSADEPAVVVAPVSRPARLPRLAGPLLGGVAGAALTLAVLAAGGVFEDPVIPEPPPPGTTVIREVVERPVIASIADNHVSAIADKVLPSIVSVNVGREGSGGFASAGSGSGVVYREDGYIITNNHVVEVGPDVQVTFPDGRIYPATVEGRDPLTDLAVLKVGTVSVVPITVAELSSLSIGDLAVAVGNPLGLRGRPSVTSGIISAFERAMQVDSGLQLFGLIQTDAAITRGSSGGALLNEQGELIGITTAIGTSGIAAEGLGFAIPVDVVQQVADDLIATGSVRHAFLGIKGQPAFEETPDGASIPQGAEIQNLETGSAIGEAGAQVGDIITSFDGQPIETMDQLVAVLRNYRADQIVDVTILRGSQVIDLSVTLDLRPNGL
ncbi:MAG: S1C family serine protease [Acidimicrobiia bacterium]